jgi:hypothetical protein
MGLIYDPNRKTSAMSSLVDRGIMFSIWKASASRRSAYQCRMVTPVYPDGTTIPLTVCTRAQLVSRVLAAESPTWTGDQFDDMAKAIITTEIRIR